MLLVSALLPSIHPANSYSGMLRFTFQYDNSLHTTPRRVHFFGRTLKLLLIAATNFSDFSENSHNRLIKYAHYFVSCINLTYLKQHSQATTAACARGSIMCYSPFISMSSSPSLVRPSFVKIALVLRMREPRAVVSFWLCIRRLFLT